MKRAVTALAATLLAAVLVPAAASAANIEIGVTASPIIAPTCPADAQGSACTIVLTQVTAYETRRDGVVNPTKIQEAGVISSFTLGLTGTSTITAKDIAYLDKTYGGPAEAQLTILHATGTSTRPAYRVAAQSPVFKVQPELGQVAEFPLVAPLPVVRGELVALTVPTWAPVLSFELEHLEVLLHPEPRTVDGSPKTRPGRPRTSRAAAPRLGANLAQITIGELSNYSCNFLGTRIEYSALEITTPAGFSSQQRKRWLRGADSSAAPGAASRRLSRAPRPSTRRRRRRRRCPPRAQACRAGTTRRRARPGSRSRRR